MPLNLVNF